MLLLLLLLLLPLLLPLPTAAVVPTTLFAIAKQEAGAHHSQGFFSECLKTMRVR